MAKSVFFMAAILIFVCAGFCAGAEDGFESTSTGITESLLKSDNPGRSSQSRGWEPLNKPSEPVKTRSIKVLKKEKGVEIWETVQAPEKRTGGFVNLQIQFDVNSYTIRPASFKVLDELAGALSDPRLKDRTIFINGHTDSDGKTAYNNRLSLNRALAVKQYLVKRRRVSPRRLRVRGYGESMPLRPNTSTKNKQRNRRVEIVAQEH